MAAKALNVLFLTLIIMSIYSTAITMIVHSIPADSLQYVEAFRTPANEFNSSGLATDTQTAYSDMRSKIPLINVGALVFYTGNFLVDFLGNFLTSIPQMITLLISSLSLFGITIDSFLLASVQLLISVLFGAIFLIFLMILLNDLRSGRQIST